MNCGYELRIKNRSERDLRSCEVKLTHGQWSMDYCLQLLNIRRRFTLLSLPILVAHKAWIKMKRNYLILDIISIRVEVIQTYFAGHASVSVDQIPTVSYGFDPQYRIRISWTMLVIFCPNAMKPVVKSFSDLLVLCNGVFTVPRSMISK